MTWRMRTNPDASWSCECLLRANWVWFPGGDATRRGRVPVYAERVAREQKVCARVQPGYLRPLLPTAAGGAHFARRADCWLQEAPAWIATFSALLARWLGCRCIWCAQVINWEYSRFHSFFAGASSFAGAYRQPVRPYDERRLLDVCELQLILTDITRD